MPKSITEVGSYTVNYADTDQNRHMNNTKYLDWIYDLLSAAWDVGVIWQDGRRFHGPNHIRINLALPLSRVQEAFERLDKYVFNA